MLSQNVPPAGATPLYKACSMRPPPNHTTPPNCRAAPAPHLQVIQAQVVLQHRARRGAQLEVAEPVAPQHVEHVDRRPRALVEHEAAPIEHRGQARVAHGGALRGPAARLPEPVRGLPGAGPAVSAPAAAQPYLVRFCGILSGIPVIQTDVYYVTRGAFAGCHMPRTIRLAPEVLVLVVDDACAQLIRLHVRAQTCSVIPRELWACAHRGYGRSASMLHDRHNMAIALSLLGKRYLVLIAEECRAAAYRAALIPAAAHCQVPGELIRKLCKFRAALGPAQARTGQAQSSCRQGP